MQKVMTGDLKVGLGKGCAKGTDPGTCNKAKILRVALEVLETIQQGETWR